MLVPDSLPCRRAEHSLLWRLARTNSEAFTLENSATNWFRRRHPILCVECAQKEKIDLLAADRYSGIPADGESKEQMHNGTLARDALPLHVVPQAVANGWDHHHASNLSVKYEPRSAQLIRWHFLRKRRFVASLVHVSEHSGKTISAAD